MRAVKPPSTPAVETVVVDLIEEPVPGVTVVTEFEATEVRDESGATPAPPESRRTIRMRRQPTLPIPVDLKGSVTGYISPRNLWCNEPTRPPLACK